MSSACSCRTVREAEWHEREISFADRSFYSRPIRLFFHLPLNLVNQAEALVDEVRMKNYQIVEPVFMLREDGSFRGQLMVEIEKPRFFDPRVYTFDKRKLYSVVSSRPWGQLGPDVMQARTKLEADGLKVGRIYLWHTTCPKCRDFRGFQTIILVQPADEDL